MLRTFVGFRFDLFPGLDPVASKLCERVRRGLDCEDVLDSQVLFQPFDHDGFGHGAFLCRRSGALPEFDVLEVADLSAHEEVEGDVQGFGQADEHGRRGHHFSRFIFADRLKRNLGIRAIGEILQRQSGFFSEPASAVVQTCTPPSDGWLKHGSFLL